ncbi:hypothetical protein BDK88_4333 [Natrinema hispanicum]|uniref:Uncharacterized protein n=1 Tax=Natrinema hispanicum TaxID=392421 RepID=A0A482Y189_9EURY|nr:hypothetical protein BDK88_4333 [Natrinema hispanicum]
MVAEVLVAEVVVMELVVDATKLVTANPSRCVRNWHSFTHEGVADTVHSLSCTDREFHKEP